MIGPAARRHAMKALSHAGRAELALAARQRIEPALKEAILAEVEIIRAQAFYLLQEETKDE